MPGRNRNMPATPAWPPASTPRLFVEPQLSAGLALTLADAQAHYLGKVMRLTVGSPLLLCDNQTGEWLGEISQLGKRTLDVNIIRQTRPYEPVPDLWLLAAPIKAGRIDWVAEKACELGVARLVPVITQRTIVTKPNSARLRAHMVEAAEQCGRTALSDLAEPVKLEQLLRAWPNERQLLFADETLATDQTSAAKLAPGRAAPAAILIGPEGGFTDAERSAIRALPQARPLSLGPRILRADTAAVAALAIWLYAQ
jgi:16S rRNA (uracil1498-N3)-methyltransferase